MKRPTVLLADDHEIVLEGLRRVLESQFDIVGAVRDGAALVETAEELKPDLIIADISMPVLNGFDAAKLIRDCAPDTSVLFLTGSASSADVAQARAAGGVGYVTKDKLATELVDAIVSAPVRA